MPTVPRSNGIDENSAGRSGRVGGAGACGGQIATLLAELHVARLRHEAVDHAVKDDAVIGPLFRECHDLLDMLGCHLGHQVDHDGPGGGAGHLDHQVRAGAIGGGAGRAGAVRDEPAAANGEAKGEKAAKNDPAVRHRRPPLR